MPNLLALVLALALPGAAPADSASSSAADSASWSAADSTAAPADSLAAGPERDVDYLWVVRTALLSEASIDSVVDRAHAMGVRGLLVQVVGRGDAYYRSDRLPRAEALAGRDPSFDPLGTILERAHAEGLEVHAWMNCLLVWSGRAKPRDRRHVVLAHPEWVARLRDGRSMIRLSERECRRLGVEGAYLSPAHPGVRAWIAENAHEIAARYAVDGIHLDYIRQPDAAVGYDPTTRARFALETGVDPGRFARVPRVERASVTLAWAEFQRDQVTAIVREVRASLRDVRPNLTLSAAVVADTLRAEHGTAQAWREWIRTRLLDRVYLMCYAPSVQGVMNQLLALSQDLGATSRVVPGIAVYNTSLGTAAVKIKGARALGFPLVALYSYDSLFEIPTRWPELREHLRASASDDIH